MSSPNPGAGALDAVAAASTRDAWAVGNFDIGIPPVGKTLIEHWDGSRWRIVSSPSPGQSFNSLNGVIALAANDAWAVGMADAGGLIEHWDGTAWRTITPPTVANAASLSFAALSADSPTDIWAVGTYTPQGGAARTLTAHWNGGSWQIISSPSVGANDQGLTGVAAVSGDDVWAVGASISSQGNFSRLILHWNGAIWQAVSSPSMNNSQYDALVGVAAGSAGDVWAVGDYGNASQAPNALLEHWNGSQWSTSASPTSGSARLNAVSVFSGGNGTGGSETIWAVGVDYSRYWDGTKWTSQTVADPLPGGDTLALLGVAAVSTNEAWAVGFSQIPHSQQVPLIEHDCTG